MTSDEQIRHADHDGDEERWLRDALAQLAAAGAAIDAGAGAPPVENRASDARPTPSARMRGRARAVTLAAAAAVVLVVAMSSVVLAARTPTPRDDLMTSGSVAGQPPAGSGSTTPAPAPPATGSPMPPTDPPRWSTPGACVYDAEAGPFFTGVELPAGMTRLYSRRDCGVLGEPSFQEDWYDGDPRLEGTRRISLIRIEQLAAGTPIGSGRSDEWTTVEGKPAEVLGNEVASGNPNLIQVSWEQDANGSAQVVAEGYDLATIVAIAESFDRAVARDGPRATVAPLSRATAADRARSITGSLSGIGEPTLVRTTPAALAARGGPVIPAEVLAADRPVWVVAATVSGNIPAPFGDPGDKWGAVVLDAVDGRLLTTATGGPDGSTWPGWLDGLEDEAALTDPP